MEHTDRHPHPEETHMHIPKWVTFIGRIALLASIPVLLIVSPLYLFVTPGFVRYEYAREGFPASSRFTHEERLRISDSILHYLRGVESVDEMASVRTDGGQVALRDSEVQHLVDVKGVMDAFFAAHAIAIALALVACWFLWRSRQKHLLSNTLQHGLWVTAGLILLVIMSSFIDFDSFFTRFHQLFFTADTWLFYETDTLIQLYPILFWIDAIAKIALSIFLEAGLLYALSALLKRLIASKARD